ncbi:3-isopropylmalate dehydratase small subunit [Secundilactobacillus hailunensis]|uniref:3-isopropylmalate dehydratase small subunit n=1 Tax=Secundilactobacillus hailunensis TaxID=2559923 RepID=A0ABW1T7X3_9LACO|nr:3-isopropylmalate dehydratase small subunit [Secundilactobacillus hailunensis]
MKTTIEGKIIVLGNNIDTDQIYPGRYLELTDPVEIGKHCLEGVDKNIGKNFPKGGIVVAGTNYGCGSSREHAVITMLHMGASAVIADSFARIFYRNAVNLSLVPVICKGISQHVKDGDDLKIDLDKGVVKDLTTGEEFKSEKITGQPLKILDAGGIKPYMRHKLGVD